MFYIRQKCVENKFGKTDVFFFVVVVSCVLFVVVVVLSNDVIFGFVKVIQHRTQIVGIALLWSRVESCLVGNYFDIFAVLQQVIHSILFKNISTKLFILEYHCSPWFGS